MSSMGSTEVERMGTSDPLTEQEKGLDSLQHEPKLPHSQGTEIKETSHPKSSNWHTDPADLHPPPLALAAAKNGTSVFCIHQIWEV